MKKNSSNYNNEISIVEIFNTIMDAKIGIILILFISILIGNYFNFQNSKSFNYSLNISSSKDTEFTRFLPMYNLVYEDLMNPEPNQENMKKNVVLPTKISEIMLERFVKEIMDYEELISIFSKNKRIMKSISGLSIKEKKEALYIYATSLSLYQPNLKDPSRYKLNFVWENIEEGKDILNELFNLTSKNFENRIFKELNDLMEIKKKSKLNDDLVRIEYLTEQSLIAKELDIKNNKEDSLNLSDSSVSFNINIQNVAYYLRGYIMIDKEIDLIKARNYIQIENMANDINLLKDVKINWAEYNVNYVTISEGGNPRLVWVISIGLGFVVALLYAFIVNIINTPNVFRKKIR